MRLLVACVSRAGISLANCRLGATRVAKFGCGRSSRVTGRGPSENSKLNILEEADDSGVVSIEEWDSVIASPVTGNSGRLPMISLAQSDRSMRSCTTRSLVVFTQAVTGM